MVMDNFRVWRVVVSIFWVVVGGDGWWCVYFG